MLIPSIDIMGGRAVQLVNGKRFELDGGDPLERAREFSLFGEFAVVDLDAAIGAGSNKELVLELAKRYRCRVGGGIRDRALAVEYLDAGASAIMIGTMARADFLTDLPRERLIAALDSDSELVMDSGWTRPTGRRVAERALELAPCVGGFLFTAIEREGTMAGADLEAFKTIANSLRVNGYKGKVTVAGGFAAAAEIAELDASGIDAQVGMALYKGKLDPVEALCACMKSDRPDGLWPTVVCDEQGVALGLAYSDADSLRAAVSERAGVYRSRKRGLWRKGAVSGDTQVLLQVGPDCDRDALRFTVRLDTGQFCHAGGRSCFAPPDCGGGGFGRLDRAVSGRLASLAAGSVPAGSYTARLYRERGLLESKLAEEARELVEAAGPERSAEEAADLLFFTAVKLAREGSSLAEAAGILDRRALRVTRRPGDAKENITNGGGAVWTQGIH